MLFCVGFHTSEVDGRTQPAAGKLFVCLFVFCKVRGLKKLIPVKMCILSRFAELNSVLFNLLRVFDLLFGQVCKRVPRFPRC